MSIKMDKKLLFVIILAITLRLPQLNSSFWLDEAAQALESARPLSQQLSIVNDFQPPLLHLIIHFAQYFSHNEVWLRFWGALLPGILTVFITYQLGVKLFSKKIALVASLLLATSSFHIFYSQELRPYALPALFAALSWSYLLVPPKSKQEKSWQLKLILVSAAGLYSSYLYPFVLITQGIFVLFGSEKFKKKTLTALSLAVFLFSPWLPSFLEQLSTGQLLRTQLSGWESVVSTPQLKSLPLTAGKFFYGVIDLDFSLAFLLVPAIVMAVLVFNFFATCSPKLKNSDAKKLFNSLVKNKRYNSILALLLWGFLSIVLSWLVSFVVPVLQPKRVLFALPAIYLLTSFAFVSLWEKAQKNAKPLESQLCTFALTLIFLVNIFGNWQYYINPKLQRENWRGLISNLQTMYPEKASVMVVSFPEAFAPLRWYDNSYEVIATGEFKTENVGDLAKLLKPVVEYNYVITFDYLSDLTDEKRLIPATISSFAFQEVDYLDYPNIGLVRIFSRKESITAYAHRN